MFVEFENLAPDSRVWIYQADRPLSEEEAEVANAALKEFAATWVAHGKPVHADAAVHHQLFLVFAADVKASAISGCSIDSSVQVVKALGEQFGVDFFNRLNVALEHPDERLQVLHRSALESAVKAGEIAADAPTFDNMIQTKEEFENRWQRPLSDTWAAV